MKKLHLLLIILFMAGSCIAQEVATDSSFKADFAKALDIKFSEQQLNKMFDSYAQLLTPQTGETRLHAALKGEDIAYFPLSYFSSDTLYTNHINALLASANPYQRILAYLVIASADDTGKEAVLLEKITTETNAGNLVWAGMALLCLQTSHTTPLFDFLVKNEDFGDAHLLPLFIRLNNDSLQHTAYSRINSEDTMSKILAAQVLAYTPLNAKTEAMLKHAVQTWDMAIKGYAIFSLGELQAGNLLKTLKPLLANSETRSVSLQALANSPTKADRDFLLHLADGQDTVASDLLDCLYYSKNIDNLKYWLSLLSSRHIPAAYYFAVFKQPLITTDEILPNLQTALQKVTDRHVLSELVRALENRDDEKSVAIIKALLQHKSASVRYWAATTVENSSSPQFKEAAISALIKAGLDDGDKRDD